MSSGLEDPHLTCKLFRRGSTAVAEGGLVVMRDFLPAYLKYSKLALSTFAQAPQATLERRFECN